MNVINFRSGLITFLASATFFFFFFWSISVQERKSPVPQYLYQRKQAVFFEGFFEGGFWLFWLVGWFCFEGQIRI